MKSHRCRNPTCTAQTPTTYCSRRCQLAMRNTGQIGYGHLPDIWVGMDTERALRARAEALGLSVRDLVVNLLEADLGPRYGWDQLDFGDGA